MTVPRNLLRLALLLLAVPLLGASSRSQSTDVTVLLFRTEQVEQVHVKSAGAIVQRCSACAQQRGAVSLDLKQQGGKLIDGANRPLQELLLQGNATVVTGARHQATATGRWQIDAANGHLRVSVELPRERYVAAVMSAEADPNEPAASLKALAVVARSFTAAGPARHESGALCDTTHCQALRLEPVPESVQKAVWSTSGETLWYGSRQVRAYFSQHCGGFAEDASAAWGGPAEPWLVAHVDPWCARVPANWQASLSRADVRRALAAEGILLPSPLQQIATAGKDPSGRIRQLRLIFEGGSQTVQAAAFRFAMNRTLGWNQLRSDGYQVQRAGDRFVFQGSGFGHGVGLCQAGAAAMAKAGKSYREILRFYFPGTAVRVLRKDAGWVESIANGFTLRTMERNISLEAAAASAFADAKARWGKPLQFTPALTVFPSTEAFRQATGQPGWTLAVTEGGRVSTQSAAVLNLHGGAHAVFRHEFLHSFVESQAAAAAPLWLREGLVEQLNGEPCPEDTLLTTAQVDASLRLSASLQESQQAHRAACAWTRRYVREHGWDATYALLQRR